MGQIDTLESALSYETRELAWELQQQHIDQERIRYLMDLGADLKSALGLAHIEPAMLTKNPTLRQLQLQKHLN